MRIVFPLFWPRLGRQASWEQAANTMAALARHGHEITVLMPQGPADAHLRAQDIRDWFGVQGDFRLVQRRSDWAGEKLHRTLLWLRQVFRDPEVQGADLLYSRIPAMVAMGGLAPLPFATDHYRPWPDIYPAIRPLVRRTACHPNSLGLIIHSHYAADAYRRAGVADERILVAHNGYDAPADWPAKQAARARLGLPPDRSIVVYAGRLNAEKGLEVLLDVADLRPGVLFVLVGSEGEGEIERVAAQRTNVQIAKWAGPDLLPTWLATADVLAIPPSRAPLDRYGSCVLPMKLFAYLAAGRPILAPANPDTAELLTHATTAWLVEPDRPWAAAEALDRLLGDTALAAQLSEKAQELANGLTWDRRAAAISGFLEAGMALRSSRTLPRPRL